MARAPLFALVLGVCVVVLSGAVAAQDGEPREIHISAFNVGDQYWFEVEGVDGRNPAIHLRPGERVEVTLDNSASVDHNIRFGFPLNREMPIQEPGRQDTMTFRVPEEANEESAYWCQPHESLGMRGRLVFGQGEEEAPGGIWGGVVGLLSVLMVAGGLLWTHRSRLQRL